MSTSSTRESLDADMGRFIVIGDIHGCFEELEELIGRLQLRPDDRAFQVGDIINRGPDSSRCLELVRTTGIRCILGNHERRLLRYHRTGDRSLLKDYDLETIRVMTADDWRFLEDMPVFRYEESLGVLLVHAGFVPVGYAPWSNQPSEILTEIDVVDNQGRALKRTDAPGCPPWADLWKGPPYVIYGHIPRLDVYRKDWSLGIDTACVYGGKLTAVILPEGDLVQVPAREEYLRKTNLAAPAPQE